MLMTAPMLTPKDFEFPAIMLSGVVDHGMYLHFKNCLSTAPQQGLVVVEISTLGGDPEIARMMGGGYPLPFGPLSRTAAGLPRQDRRLFRRRHLHELLRHRNRYLTRGTRLMIHERLITKNIHLEGPLSTCIATLKASLHEIEASIAIQNEGFANLILGSQVTMEEVLQRAPENWYLEANEAAALGLVATVL